MYDLSFVTYNCDPTFDRLWLSQGKRLDFSGVLATVILVKLLPSIRNRLMPLRRHRHCDNKVQGAALLSAIPCWTEGGVLKDLRTYSPP